MECESSDRRTNFNYNDYLKLTLVLHILRFAVWVGFRNAKASLFIISRVPVNNPAHVDSINSGRRDILL